MSAAMTPDPTPRCLCDGGAYEVKDHPFLVNPTCSIHGSDPTPMSAVTPEAQVIEKAPMTHFSIAEDGTVIQNLPLNLREMVTAPDERVEIVAGVLHDAHWRSTGSANWALTPTACQRCMTQAAAVVAALASEPRG